MVIPHSTYAIYSISKHTIFIMKHISSKEDYLRQKCIAERLPKLILCILISFYIFLKHIKINTINCRIFKNIMFINYCMCEFEFQTLIKVKFKLSLY